MNEFCRRFRSYPKDTGDIVAGISHESHHLDHTIGVHSELFDDILTSEPFVLHRIQHVDVRRNQLHHILVTTNDGDLHPLCFTLLGQGANDVIGLETWLAQT